MNVGSLRLINREVVNKKRKLFQLMLYEYILGSY